MHCYCGSIIERGTLFVCLLSNVSIPFNILSLSDEPSSPFITAGQGIKVGLVLLAVNDATMQGKTGHEVHDIIRVWTMDIIMSLSMVSLLNFDIVI